jgi:hypothetical protein
MPKLVSTEKAVHVGGRGSATFRIPYLSFVICHARYLLLAIGHALRRICHLPSIGYLLLAMRWALANQTNDRNDQPF